MFSQRTLKIFKGVRAVEDIQGMLIWEVIERETLRFGFKNGAYIPTRVFTELPTVGLQTFSRWTKTFVDAGILVIDKKRDGTYYYITEKADSPLDFLDVFKTSKKSSNNINIIIKADSEYTPAPAPAREELVKNSKSAIVLIADLTNGNFGHAGSVWKKCQQAFGEAGMLDRLDYSLLADFTLQWPEDLNFPTVALPRHLLKFALDNPPAPVYERIDNDIAE